MPVPILLHSASLESGCSLTPTHTHTHTVQLECAEAVLHTFLPERGEECPAFVDNGHRKQPVHYSFYMALPAFSCEDTLGKQAVNETDVWVFSKYPYKARTFERNLD